jgi:hypothetical protein
MVLFREDFNFPEWGTFHKDSRLHKVTIDKGICVSAYLPDVDRAQGDLNLMNRCCMGIAEEAFIKMEIPKGVALFVARVMDVEMLKSSGTLQDKLRMLVGYGYKLLDPIRRATEVIGRAAAQGKDFKEILVELDMEGF